MFTGFCLKRLEREATRTIGSAIQGEAELRLKPPMSI